MKVAYSSLILLIIVSVCHSLSTPCNLRETSHGSVCVCNAVYCDYLDDFLPNENDDIVCISSSKKGLRFSKTNAKFSDQKFTVNDYGNESIEFEPMVILNERGSKTFSPFSAYAGGYQRTSKLVIDRNEKYQHMEGFGGAFTGSVSYILDQISEPLQNHIYKSFFSNDGIAYNMMRLSIGGSDFDLEPWAYNELPKNDIKLSNFTKLDDRDIEKIAKIQKLMKVTNNYNIKIKAAAWSPPPWMKSNNRWTGFSSLKKEFYQTWADYHLKFLELMAAKNISIWAISTGNEPLNGVIGWFFVRFMSLGWTAKNQGIWLDQNLGPTVRNSKFKDVKILGNDDQRYSYPAWFKQMEKAAPGSTSYLDGFAVHWYWDSIFNPSLIDETMNMFKGKLLLNTESCVGDKPYETHGPELGSWDRAEKYARSYLQDLQHGFHGWIDWNIILDEHGGPNYVNNTVDAPVIIRTASGSEEIYKQPIFYAIGHFSKFIPEGSIRIKSERLNINIDSVSYVRPDGYISCVIYNSGRASVDVTISDSIRGNIVVNIPERSMHTIIYK